MPPAGLGGARNTVSSEPAFRRTWDRRRRRNRTAVRSSGGRTAARSKRSCQLAPGAPGIRIGMPLGTRRCSRPEQISMSSGTDAAKRSSLRSRSSSAPRDVPDYTPSATPAKAHQILAMGARELPGRHCLPRTRISWVATRDPDPELLRERRRPRHHRSLEIPIESINSAVCRPSLDTTKRPRERPLR